MPFLLPSLLLLLPGFLFFTGLGHLLGRVHQALPYVLMALVFLAGAGVSDYVLDPFCAGYFAAYPLTLKPGQSGGPDYFMQPIWLAARMLYLLLGIVLFLWNAQHAKRKRTRAEV